MMLVKKADLFTDLCWLLSERGEQVDWATYQAQDWEAFTSLAIRHGVASLANKVLGQLEIRSVPIPHAVTNELRKSYHSVIATNTFLYQELDNVLGLLSEANIDVILLKGADLAQTLYDDIGDRPMGDIDLLVRESAVSQIYPLLLANGYNPERSLLRLGIFKGILYEANFSRQATIPVNLEFHWSLIGGRLSRHFPDIEWFWSGSEQQDVRAAQIRTLGIEAKIAYLAAHLAMKHVLVTSQLLWNFDLYRLLNKYRNEIDWDLIESRVKEFNWAAGVAEALFAVNQRLNAPLPENILENLNRKNDLDSRYIDLRASATTGLDRAKAEASLVNFWGKILWWLEFAFPTLTYLKWKYGDQKGLPASVYYWKHLVTIFRSIILNVR